MCVEVNRTRQSKQEEKKQQQQHKYPVFCFKVQYLKCSEFDYADCLANHYEPMRRFRQTLKANWLLANSRVVPHQKPSEYQLFGFIQTYMSVNAANLISEKKKFKFHSRLSRTLWNRAPVDFCPAWHAFRVIFRKQQLT